MIAAAQNVSIAIKARSRRVLVLSDALPERNGVGTYYRDLVDQLRGHVDRAELICPDADMGWRGRLTFAMPGDRTQVICAPPLRRLLAYVNDLRPDVVIAATPGPFGLSGLYLARRHGAPLICGFHTHLEGLTDLYWASGPGRLFGRMSRAFLDGANRLLFRCSEAVIANSPEMAGLARGLGAGRVELVGTPLARDFLSPPEAPVSGNLGRVLFAGRLAPEKNVHQVIDAARSHPDHAFVIAGDGPLRDRVAAADRELPNLTWLGWQPRAAMRGIIDAADLLVLPSSVESFGTIALEAMARERLALVSPACGILAWPDLARGLFAMIPGETVTGALRRIRALGPEPCLARARLGRRAALELAHRNTRGWLDLMAGAP